jgi:hypothetical protein
MAASSSNAGWPVTHSTMVSAAAEVSGDDGVGHRLWLLADDPLRLDEICARIGAGPITIARL